MDITSLSRYEIPGHVVIVEGSGGLPEIRIANNFAEAEICLYAGHVARFQPKGEAPVLWMSPSSPFTEGKAIRGGIPVCFPWFGPHRSKKEFPVHGFVRYRMWNLDSCAQLSDGRTQAVLSVSSDETTKEYWPHDFVLSMTVTVGTKLDCVLEATNTGREPFAYEDCMHTYFTVGDPAQTQISGFDGVGYIDRTRADSRSVQTGTLVLSGETVNAYMLDGQRCTVLDPVMKRRIVIEKSGSKASVVWNPWAASAAKNAEIGEGWKEFLCVESANCLDVPITLLPGTSHKTSVSYGVERI